MTNLVFYLMGPTASGKTALATELVQYYPFEIISVDSAMVYREMDIGTAKPSLEEQARTPHHLIDIIDPIASYSAAQFCQDAEKLCQDIRQRNKIPLLVGGSMMYFNALHQGLSVLPKACPDTRQRINEEAALNGWRALHQRLSTIDPLAAARIHPHDSQRIGRALEVYYLTGQNLSEHLKRQGTKENPPQVISFALFPQQRAWLHQRIAQRFEQMLKTGFIEEVERLLAKWPLTLGNPALRSVGYRQVFEALHGQTEQKDLREKAIAATRQLAKRQLTWLRSWPDVLYFDPEETETQNEIMAKIREILDNDLQNKHHS